MKEASWRIEGKLKFYCLKHVPKKAVVMRVVPDPNQSRLV